MMFADDTVIFAPGKSQAEVESKLRSDIDHLHAYLTENDLIMNVKKGKTEAMLFGSARKLTKCTDLNLNYNGIKINSTTKYKYLGTQLDQTVKLQDHFNET